MPELIVYVATNKSNGKHYVGVTMQSLKARIAQHKCRSRAGSRAFPNAIAKYGVDGFAWEVVQRCLTAEELNAAECEWIANLNSLADGGHGYNRTTGGGGTAGCRASDETRQRQSAVRRRANFVRFPRKRQQSLFNKRFGTRHRPESIEQIRLSMLGKRNNLKLDEAKITQMLSMRKAGLSQQKIGDALGVTREAISYALKRTPVPS